MYPVHFSYLFVGLHPEQRFFEAPFGGLGYVASDHHHKVRGQLPLAVHRGPVSGQHYIQRLLSNTSRAGAPFALDRLVVNPHIGDSLVDAVFGHPADGRDTTVTSVLIQYHRKYHRSGRPKGRSERTRSRSPFPRTPSRYKIPSHRWSRQIRLRRLPPPSHEPEMR